MQGKLQNYLKKKIPKNTYQLLHLIDKHSNQEETYLAKNTQKKHSVIITVNLKAKLKTLGFIDPSDDLSLRQQPQSNLQRHVETSNKLGFEEKQANFFMLQIVCAL
ncbi:hypothetical protein PPERSA_08715 [Pseudocohnilembus persalinus]|uniref:Uncharacterized protein n=1 Tax=Pseudocohnilembus persalinus TaxID=266149 RepID=A0A0V0QXW8_PSEPJ|nr:hypothetical protein PPERSA_08715 [Pseudocohnilembus persalinus]|eukprot:KRX07038.1 hypothetical protein PPERSA_08715 [Pseudocohnilembus persalinus]